MSIDVIAYMYSYGTSVDGALERFLRYFYNRDNYNCGSTYT